MILVIVAGGDPHGGCTGVKAPGTMPHDCESYLTHGATRPRPTPGVGGPSRPDGGIMSILTATAPNSTIAPPPMRAVAMPPRKKPKWSVEEFHRIRATGIWDGLRTYLIRGEIWEQGPMTPPHANYVDRINEALRAIFTAGYRVRVQTPS